MPQKKQPKKINVKKITTKKNCFDYTTDEWLKKENTRIEQEFKKYNSDLEPNSGKSEKECVVTAMTFAHHGTEKALETLKKFKKDSRAPMWIDCAIEECEMMHWEDTIGKKISEAEENLKTATEKVMEEKLAFSKEIIINSLKIALEKQGTKFTYGEKVKLYFDKKIVAEEDAEFIIDDVLSVSIKPKFTEWIFRFKEGMEGKNLREGDLENIEQGIWHDDDGKKLEEPRSLEESFNDFYEQQFYNLLEMSGKTIGILLDFSGEKIYGKYFSVPLENGVTLHSCSGWCEGCFEELKCETAQEFKEEDDKKRYRILKKLMKQIVEIEGRIKSTKWPSGDLEYEMGMVEKLKDEAGEKLKNAQKNKKADNKEEIEKLEEEIKKWDIEISALSAVLAFESPKQEDLDELKILRKKYDAIKNELQTKEYKNDVEGLEVYYGKAEPSGDACYHDPLCDCGEYDEFCDESCDCDEEEIYGGLDSDIPF